MDTLSPSTAPETSSATPSQSSPTQQQLKTITTMLDNACAMLAQVKHALDEFSHSAHASTPSLASYSPSTAQPTLSTETPAPEFHHTAESSYNPLDRIVEGVFNGSSMVGLDGKIYQVPPNYASKSKLVEGDRLKLIIRPNGMFVYKQISPVTRDRLVGILERDETGHGFCVRVAQRVYNILLASVTYYHGEVGDEVVLLVPPGGNSRWAAVENIIRVVIGRTPDLEYASPAPVATSSPLLTPPSPQASPTNQDLLSSDIDSILSDFSGASTPPSV